MSSFASSLVRALPSGLLGMTARFILSELADEADQDLSCDLGEEEIARRCDAGVSTVRKWLVWLASEGWVARERARHADGSWGSYRYWLSLEKLRPHLVHRSNRAVAGGVDGLVDNTTAQIEQPPPDNAPATARSEQPPLNSSGPIRKFFLPSFFIFKEGDPIWEVADRILAACGPGLADPALNRRLTNSLAQRVNPESPACWFPRFDLEADVLPVVARQTGKPRPAGKAVVDFALFDEDLALHRLERIRATAPDAETRQAIEREAAVRRATEADREHRLGIQRETLRALNAGQVGGSAEELAAMRVRTLERIAEIDPGAPELLAAYALTSETEGAN